MKWDVMSDVVDLSNSPVEVILIEDDDPPVPQEAPPPPQFHMPPAFVREQAAVAPQPVKSEVEPQPVKSPEKVEPTPAKSPEKVEPQPAKSPEKVEPQPARSPEMEAAAALMGMARGQDGAAGGSGRMDEFSDEDLKVLWHEYIFRTDHSKCNYTDDEIAKMIQKPVSKVTNFMQNLVKDAEIVSEPEDYYDYDQRIIEAYENARTEAIHRTYEEVAKESGLSAATLQKYAESRVNQFEPSMLQKVMLELNRKSRMNTISEMIVELNKIPFGNKYTYYSYLIWLYGETDYFEPSSGEDEEESDHEDEEPQGEGGAGGSAGRKRQPKGKKKRSPKKARGGKVHKSSRPFHPKQVELMQQELDYRTSEEKNYERNVRAKYKNQVELVLALGKPCFSQKDIRNRYDKLLKELNQNNEGWRKVDRQALIRWMSNHRGE